MSAKDRIKENAKKFDAKFFENCKAKGCDYKAFGEWQKAYGLLMQYILKLKGKVVLDIGCAYGALTKAIANYCDMAIGLDISKHAIDAQAFDGIQLVHGTAQTLSKHVEAETVDIIHSSFAFNEISKYDMERTFKEMKKVLKEDGKVLIIMNFKDEPEGEFQYSKKMIEEIGEEILGKKSVKIPRGVFSGTCTQFKRYNWGMVLFE